MVIKVIREGGAVTLRPQKQTNSGVVGFRTLLGGKNRYVLRENQRRYAWKEKQIKQFIDDVRAIYNETEGRMEEYFFGPMVFANAGKEIAVIDGQQRLATVGVFLGVIRDMLIDEKKSPKSKSVQNNIQGMLQFNVPERVHISRIILGEANREFFSKYIVNKKSAEEKIVELNKKYTKKDPNYWLAYAYCEFYVTLKKLMRNKTLRSYNKLLSIVLDIFTVVRIIASSLKAGFLIFETLNERGVRLADNDLLKNYVLGHCDRQDFIRINKLWEDMINELKGRNPDEYLRYFWIANHEHVTKYELYTYVTNYLKRGNTKAKIKKYVESLSEQARIFSALHNPDRNNRKWWNDKELIRDLVHLNVLDGQLVKIVLLIAKARVGGGAMNRKKYKRLVHVLICYFYRSRVIHNKNATDIERAMASVAKDIQRAKKSNMQRIEEVIKNDKTYPSDVEFQNTFGGKKLSRRIQKYTLLQLELKINPNSDVEPLSTITVEHIMPKKLTPYWNRQIKESDYIRLLDTIGNLTLLKRDKNIKLGNSTWDEKSAVYKTSQIRITKSIAKNKKWKRKEIEERSEYFSKLAKKVWAV